MFWVGSSARDAAAVGSGSHLALISPGRGLRYFYIALSGHFRSISNSSNDVKDRTQLFVDLLPSVLMIMDYITACYNETVDLDSAES